MQNKIIFSNEIDQLQEDSACRGFYALASIFIDSLDSETDITSLQKKLIALKPFIISFNNHFVSYYDLKKTPAINPLFFSSDFIKQHSDKLIILNINNTKSLARLTELYWEMINIIAMKSEDELINWLLQQQYQKEVKQNKKFQVESISITYRQHLLFPSDSKEDLSRGLRVLGSLASISIYANSQTLIDYVRNVLSNSRTPSTIQLAISTIEGPGLTAPPIISLIIDFSTSKYNEEIRKIATNALRKHPKRIKQYLYIQIQTKKKSSQKIAIAITHDRLFGRMQTQDLKIIFPNIDQSILVDMVSIWGKESFHLSRFLKSQYFTKINDPEQLTHINNNARKFKQATASQFDQLIKLWGINHLVALAIPIKDPDTKDAIYLYHSKLFDIILTAIAPITIPAYRQDELTNLPLDTIVNYILENTNHPIAYLEEFMSLLLKIGVSIDFTLFNSLLSIVSQEKAQEANGTRIEINHGIYQENPSGKKETSQQLDINYHNPCQLRPIYEFLIAIQLLQSFYPPQDSFQQKNVSLLINILAQNINEPYHGGMLYLTRKLIHITPHPQHTMPQLTSFKDKLRGRAKHLSEKIGRNGENTFDGNFLLHYIRIIIHRLPSKQNLLFCNALVEGLANDNLDKTLNTLKRLMLDHDQAKIILTDFFRSKNEQLKIWSKALIDIRDNLTENQGSNSEIVWINVAEHPDFEATIDSLKDKYSNNEIDILIVSSLLRLLFDLSDYWTCRLTRAFIEKEFNITIDNEWNGLLPPDEKLEYYLGQIQEKRFQLQQAFLDPENTSVSIYIHHQIKKHIHPDQFLGVPDEGTWTEYSESTGLFPAYHTDQRLAHWESMILERLQQINKLTVNDIFLENQIKDHLPIIHENVQLLTIIMEGVVFEGLAPSKHFQELIGVLRAYPFTVADLLDIVNILLSREYNNIIERLAAVFERYPSEVAKAIGEDILPEDIAKMQIPTHVKFEQIGHRIWTQEIGNNKLLQLMVTQLQSLQKALLNLKKIDPSYKLYTSRNYHHQDNLPTSGKLYSLGFLQRNKLPVPVFHGIDLQLNIETVKMHFHSIFDQIQKVITKLEKANHKLFMPENPFDTNRLLLTVISSYYRSLPKVFGMVSHMGYRYSDITSIQTKKLSETDMIYHLTNYFNFQLSFAETVLKLDSKIIAETKKDFFNILQKDRKSINIKYVLNKITDLKKILDESADSLPEIDFDNPVNILTHAAIAVYRSKESTQAQQIATLRNCSMNWPMIVIVKEEISSLLTTRITARATDYHGGKPPIGKVTFKSFVSPRGQGFITETKSLQDIKDSHPRLYAKIVSMIINIQKNRGNIRVNVSITAVWDSTNQDWQLTIEHQQQLPLTRRHTSINLTLHTDTDTIPVTAKGLTPTPSPRYQHVVFINGYNATPNTLLTEITQTKTSFTGQEDIAIYLLMKEATNKDAYLLYIPGIEGVCIPEHEPLNPAIITALRQGLMPIHSLSELTYNNKLWSFNSKPINNRTIYTVAGPESPGAKVHIYENLIPLRKRGSLP